MKPLILLAAIAAAALVLRRRRPVVIDADDSEVVGMPTLVYDGRFIRARMTRSGAGVSFVEFAPTSRN